MSSSGTFTSHIYLLPRDGSISLRQRSLTSAQQAAFVRDTPIYLLSTLQLLLWLSISVSITFSSPWRHLWRSGCWTRACWINMSLIPVHLSSPFPVAQHFPAFFFLSFFFFGSTFNNEAQSFTDLQSSSVALVMLGEHVKRQKNKKDFIISVIPHHGNSIFAPLSCQVIFFWSPV